jgi:non-ribosomal peptide synthetase component F
MTTTAGAPARLEEIARRLGALPRHKQDEFVAWLASRDIGVLSLPIVAQPRPERVPLSHAQRSMWLLDQLHPGGSEYNVPRVFTLSGALDQAALAAALAGLVARHEVLRTTFAAEDGEPFQVIGPPPAVDLDPVDLTSLPADQRRARARELADAEAGRPFDLARGPLFRARLLRLDRRAHWLLLTSHHIVMDEWSDEVLAGELVELYDAHRRGRAPALAPLPIQYADHAVWQRRWLDDRVLAGQLAHWKQQLAADADPTVLPRDFPLPAEPTRAAASHRFRLDGQLTSRMRELAARGNTTLFTALLAAFHLLLHRTGGRREIRTGVPIANRHRRELEGLIGLFANTQVLSSSPRGAMTFAEHLEQVRRATVSAQANQDLPFERLVEELQPERSASHTPLFQVMFSWHRGMADKAGAPGELTIGQESVHDRTAKFDLVLHMTDGDDGVGGELLYRSELFAPGTIAALAARLVRLAAAAVERPDRPMAELDWLEPGERDRIARRWNDTDAPRPPLPLHRWIEARALEAPGAPAVRGEDELLTRGELDERAARVAGLLASRGLGVEDRIGLCVPRSPDLVAGMLGILKCGAAYVPIDPRTPRARLREILADAGVTHVVARPADAPLLEGAATVVAIHDDALAAASPLAGVDVPPGAAAYVLYTSGSTGGPKGVVVPHGAIISYVAGLLDRLALPPAVSMALVSTPTADLGNTVLFGALCSGGLLHIVSEERCFDADGMAAYMRRHPVAVMKITPSHLGGLLQASRPGRRPAAPHAGAGRRGGPGRTARACPPARRLPHRQPLRSDRDHRRRADPRRRCGRRAGRRDLAAAGPAAAASPGLRPRRRSGAGAAGRPRRDLHRRRRRGARLPGPARSDRRPLRAGSIPTRRRPPVPHRRPRALPRRRLHRVRRPHRRSDQDPRPPGRAG